MGYAIITFNEKGFIQGVSYPYYEKPNIEETDEKKIVKMEIAEELLHEINENLEESFHKLVDGKIVRVKEVRLLKDYIKEVVEND